MLKRYQFSDLKQDYLQWNANGITKRIFDKILQKEEQKMRETMSEEKIRQCMNQLLSYPTIIIKKIEPLSTINYYTLSDNCLKNEKSTSNSTNDCNLVENKELNDNKCLKNEKNQLEKSSEKCVNNNNDDKIVGLKLLEERKKCENFENMILKKYKKRKKINNSPVSFKKKKRRSEELLNHCESFNDIPKDENKNVKLKSPKTEAIQKIFKVKLVDIDKNSNTLKNVYQKQELKHTQELFDIDKNSNTLKNVYQKQELKHSQEEDIVLENKENETVVENKKKRKHRKSIDSGIGRITPSEEIIQDLNKEEFENNNNDNNSKRRKSKNSINILELEEQMRKFKEELKLVEEGKITKKAKLSISDDDHFLVELNNNNIDSVSLMTEEQHDNVSVVPDNQRLNDVKLEENIHDEVKTLMQSIINGFALKEKESDNSGLIASSNSITNISTGINENNFTNVTNKIETVNKLNLLEINDPEISEKSTKQLVKSLKEIKEKRKYRRKKTVVLRKKLHHNGPLNSAVPTSSTTSIPPAPDLVPAVAPQILYLVEANRLPQTALPSGPQSSQLLSTSQIGLNASESASIVAPIMLTIVDQGKISTASVVPVTTGPTIDSSSTLTAQPFLDCVENNKTHQNGVFSYDDVVKTIIRCILQMRVFKIKWQSNSPISSTEMKNIMKISEIAVYYMRHLAANLKITSWRVLINNIAVYSWTTEICNQPILEQELHEIIYFYIEHFGKEQKKPSKMPSQLIKPVVLPAPGVAHNPSFQVAGGIYSNGFSPNAGIPGSNGFVGNQCGQCPTPIASSIPPPLPYPYGIHETANYCNSPTPPPYIQITNDQIIAVYCQIQIYNQLVKRTKEIVINQRLLLSQKIQASKAFPTVFYNQTLVNQRNTEVNGTCGIMHADKRGNQEQTRFNLDKAKKKKNLHSILDKIIEKKICSVKDKRGIKLFHEKLGENFEFSDVNKEMEESLLIESAKQITTPIITDFFSIPCDLYNVVDENAKKIKNIIG